jgi:ketosteroid isomerase-like protein
MLEARRKSGNQESAGSLDITRVLALADRSAGGKTNDPVPPVGGRAHGREGDPMTILERFAAYARDFEETYRDDDWSRLAQYFTPDATYEVAGSPLACTLAGPEAIFRGIKKSLDGFDRKFTERRLELAAPPVVEGDTVTVDWAGTYSRPGAPPLTLRGRSIARFAGDRIVRLTDTYADSAGVEEVAAWLRTHGTDLDASYV